MDNLLKYRISNWHQCTGCLSNLSVDLKIKVSDLVNNDDICGTKISVEHSKYGTLFLAIFMPDGNIVDNDIPRSLDRDSVLNELSRFGFYITWISELSISNSIIEQLKSIESLNYDKIRLVLVHNDSDGSEYGKFIVAFDIDKLPGWINTNYSPSKFEFEKAIIDGSALNVNRLDSGGQDWSWIYNGLYDIDSLIEGHSNIYE